MKKITICLKTADEFYGDELDGTKNNTVRFTDDWDKDRWKQFKEATYINIRHSENEGLNFERKIRHKAIYKNLAIITWSCR